MASQSVRASLWFAVANIINKGLALIATPILTRIMTTEQYGTFSVFQSWIAIFTILCTLNLFQSAYTRGAVQFEDARGRFCSSLLALSTCITLVISVIVLVNVEFWSSVLLMSPLLIGMLFLEILLVSPFEFWAATQRFDYKYKVLVIVSIAINLVSLGLGIALILNSECKVEARVFADVLAKGLPGIVCLLIIFFRGRCLFDKEFWAYALTFNLPLLPHFLSHFILNQSDRIMIGAMVGNDMAALYSVAYAIAMVMTIVMNAINGSYVPYTYKELASGEVVGIRRSSWQLLTLILVLCAVVMAFGPEILFVFAGSEYSGAVYLIPPLSCSVYFIFLYSLFVNVEYYFKKTGWTSLASVGCAVLNVVLNIVAIPVWGYAAAAWTTLFSYVALSLLHWAIYKKICKREGLEGMYDLRKFFALCLGSCGLMFCMLFSYGNIWLRIAFTALILCTVVIKRKRILALLKNKGVS